MFSISDLLHVSRLIFCLSINPCSGPSVQRSASVIDSRVIVKAGPHLSVWCTSCVVMWYIGCLFPFPLEHLASVARPQPDRVYSTKKSI